MPHIRVLLQHKMRLQGTARTGGAARCAARRHCDLSVPGLQPAHASLSERCDSSILVVVSHGPGQEGRGTGIAAKIRAYFMQTMAECDTVEGAALGVHGLMEYKNSV